jgi:uncharacterized protein YndB with AHSA1/START domain
MKAATMTPNAKPQPKSAPRMSDEAVQAKTGKTWPEWFAILDKAGCSKMIHGQIVEVLEENYNVGPWWGHMVTVGYEQERGLREKHQKPAGFEIGGSKTVDVDIATLFAAREDKKKRAKWLGAESAEIEIRNVHPSKSMRITWIDGNNGVSVNFYAKSAGKSQVTVQHSKLPNGKVAEQMKTYWAEKLVAMKEALEK